METGPLALLDQFLVGIVDRFLQVFQGPAGRQAVLPIFVGLAELQDHIGQGHPALMGRPGPAAGRQQLFGLGDGALVELGNRLDGG